MSNINETFGEFALKAINLRGQYDKDRIEDQVKIEILKQIFDQIFDKGDYPDQYVFQSNVLGEKVPHFAMDIFNNLNILFKLSSHTYSFEDGGTAYFDAKPPFIKKHHA